MTIRSTTNATPKCCYDSNRNTVLILFIYFNNVPLNANLINNNNKNNNNNKCKVNAKKTKVMVCPREAAVETYISDKKKRRLKKVET